MSFDTAYSKTMEREGFLSNNGADPGGLTFMGISKVFWPSWEGWDLLEASNYKLTDEISGAVKRFYRINFWNRVNGTEIDTVAPEIAEEVFDTAVNMGVSKAISFLQDAMNLLNVTGSLYPDIAVDGQAGQMTIFTLKRYMQYDKPGKTVFVARLLKVLNALQANHYIDQMRKNPKKEQFRGWFDRV